MAMLILVLFIVFLGLLTLGGFHALLSGTARLLKGAAKPFKPQGRNIAVVLSALRTEGFFEDTPSPRVFQNRVISEALSQGTTIEGFFWDIKQIDPALRITSNTHGELYDHILIYGNNSIGFNWRGRA